MQIDLGPFFEAFKQLLPQMMILTLPAAIAITYVWEWLKGRSDQQEEKAKRKNDELALGDDGELIDVPIATGTTLDDLIQQYDRREDE